MGLELVEVEKPCLEQTQEFVEEAKVAINLNNPHLYCFSLIHAMHSGPETDSLRNAPEALVENVDRTLTRQELEILHRGEDVVASIVANTIGTKRMADSRPAARQSPPSSCCARLGLVH